MILQIYTIGPLMILERFRAIMQTFRAALIASKAISKPTPFTWTQPEPAGCGLRSGYAPEGRLLAPGNRLHGGGRCVKIGAY
jgi:hypothetical protein